MSEEDLEEAEQLRKELQESFGGGGNGWKSMWWVLRPGITGTQKNIKEREVQRMAADNEKRRIYANEALRMMKHCKADNPYFIGKTTPVWEMAHDCAMSCIDACSTVDAVEVVRC